MKQHIEIVTKVRDIKEIQTRTGKWMYSFSIPISKMVEDTQKTEWLQVSILQDIQRSDLHGAKEVHFIGQLVLKESYRDYPQGISIFGFYIEPILNQVYRQRKVRKNISENAPQEPITNGSESQPTQNAQNGSYENDFTTMDSTVPF